MKVLVVDDEPLARERLLRFIQDIDYVNGTSVATNGLDALEKLKDFPADVVLLDIRMPGQSGLEIANTIRQFEEPPAIIFCTAYDEHALEAFRVQAQAYLLKPIQRQALEGALQACRKLTKAQIQSLSTESNVATIAVHNGREKEILPLADVYYFRAEQKYVSLFGQKGERIVDESLKALEERFESSFLRVHRNTLVNKSRVEKLQRDNDGGFWVKLKGVNELIAVSRRHAKQVKAVFE